MFYQGADQLTARSEGKSLVAIGWDVRGWRSRGQDVAVLEFDVQGNNNRGQIPIFPNIRGNWDLTPVTAIKNKCALTFYIH